MRLLRAAPRFRTYSWIRELLSRTEESWFHDPGLAEEMASLALLASDHLDARTFGRFVLEDLRAEICAYLANSRRIRSDYRGAVDAFARAEEHQRQGSGDPLEEARICVLFASFLRDLQALEDASSHLDRALSLYREAGDRHGEARSLVSKSNLERGLGNLDASTSLLEQASRGIDRQVEPRLVALIRRNQALDMSRAGDPARIRRSLEELDPARDHGYLDRLRTVWARGLVFERLGQLDRAQRELFVARTGFSRVGIPLDTALLDLDLARIYLMSDHRGRALRSATSAFPALAARGLHQATLRALDLFRQAGGLT